MLWKSFLILYFKTFCLNYNIDLRSFGQLLSFLSIFFIISNNLCINIFLSVLTTSLYMIYVFLYISHCVSYYLSLYKFCKFIFIFKSLFLFRYMQYLFLCIYKLYSFLFFYVPFSSLSFFFLSLISPYFQIRIRQRL